MRGCCYDTCCTEQQCNDCRITEFCSPGRTGRCDQYHRTGRCHPILLGDNIGTTITAVLASIGQPKDARRTAFAHCVFNISGAILFLFLVKPYAALIQFISPKGNEIDVISRQIANAHTGFNLVMTLIWIPLIPLMVKIVMKLVPDGKEMGAKALENPNYLDNKLIAQPAAALQLVAKEVMYCAKLVDEMIGKLQYRNGKIDKEMQNL